MSNQFKCASESHDSKLLIEKVCDCIKQAPVYDVAVKTPLQHMEHLSQRLHCEVLIKREDMQPVHSFKLRGAYNKIYHLSESEKRHGIVAASAGNHAQGVALSAKILNISAVIVMPRTTPDIKVNAVRKYGADVLLHGDSFDAAKLKAEQISIDQQRKMIQPYDDYEVICGQGTVAMELLEQAKELDAIYVPVGGGGLLAGIAAYVKSINPNIKIIAVEAEDSACFQAAMKNGTPIDLDSVGLFADGIAVKTIGAIPFEICQDIIDDTITVKTDEICAAIQDIFNDTRAIAEPAGAVAVAGVKKYLHTLDAHTVTKAQPQESISNQVRQTKQRKVAVILSGANMNFHALRHVSERSEFGEATEAVFAATIGEHRGSFREFCLLLDGKVITEFNYRIADSSRANVFVGVRMSDAESERNNLLAQFKDHQISVIDLTDDVLSKVHLRYMVGGIPTIQFREQVVSFDFPEVPGSLLKFLETLGDRWNITLFHYRNHGAAYGRILAGFDVPLEEQSNFDAYLQELGYRHINETDNPAYQLFLTS